MYGASKLICINRFLWVAFQLDAICAEVSDKGIERALERVPDTMDATYERILDTIKAKSRAQYELARRILIWIVYARRPLSIDELACVVSIETDTENLEDLKSSIPTEESILDACANLISVDQSKNRYVRFVHFSVQEFFTSHRSTTLNMGQEVGHREITQTCIIFLTLFPEPSDAEIHSYAFQEWPHHLLAGNIDRLQVDDSIVTLTLSFFEESPMILTKQSNDLWLWPTIYFKFSPLVLALIFDLLPTQKYTGKKLESKAIYYADLNWTVFPNDKLAIHYAIAELDSIPVVQRLYNHGYMLNYFYPVGWNCEVKIPKWLRVSPLYSVRSTKMLKHLLDNGINVDPRALYFDPFKRFAQEENWDFFQLLLDRIVDQDDRRLNNALQGTARIGKIQGIQLLLDKGADVNAQSGKYGSALQAAALSGSIGAVQLLLDKGADVNAQGGEYGSALQVAAHSGRIRAIQLLLGKGADVNAQGGKYGSSALQAVAHSGSIEAIQLLLGKGADVNAQGGEYGSALQAAAYRGNIEVIQLLLDRGADVNAQDGKYGSALQAAAYPGNIEAIQLLLDKGADVNAQGGEYGSALQAAAYQASIGAIELLLDKGADVNAQGGRYGNALQATSNIESIRLLLDKGVDVNTQSGYYGSALQALACRGNIEAIQLLLDRGADVNAQGGEYGNALQASASQGGIEAIQLQLLLDKGADVNAQGGRYGNALQAAAFSSNIESIRLLLGKGADVNAQGGRYGNALQAAAFSSNIESIRLLLGKGADVNAQGGEYGNALQAAAHSGSIKAIRLLLDKGIDINAQGGSYDNALQAAAFRGSIKAIQLLLDKGADVHAQGEKYGSALQAAAYEGSIGSIQLLLGKGVDVNAQGGYYGSALQAAASRGSIEVIQLLLDKGADVNTQGGIFGTILQAAAYHGNIEVIQLLLDNGADIYSRGGEYGATLGKMLALEPVGSSQKVPECKILLVEFLQYHKPIPMKDITDSELDYSIRAYSNKDRCNLDVFRELLESRGWRREGPSQPSTSAEKSGPRSVTPSPLCKQNKRKSSAMEDHSQAQLTCVRCGKEGHVKRPCHHDTNRCDRCGQSVHRASYVHRPKHSMVLEEVTEDQDPCQAAEMQEQTEHHSDPGSQDMDEEMSDDMVI